MVPGESSCPNSSEIRTCLAKGVESLQGRVTAAQSWPLFQKRKKYLRQCSETPRGRNFDFPEMMFKIYIKMFSQEDFALNSKLRPGGFLLHLPIFTGNSRSTGIYQLWAQKTRSKRARCHFSPVCSPMYNGVFTFSCQSQYLSSFLSWRPQKFGLQIFPKWGDADFFFTRECLFLGVFLDQKSFPGQMVDFCQ